MQELMKKIDKLDDRLDSIDKTLVKQAASLDEHIRRTNLLEDEMRGLKIEMKPVEEHVQQVKGAAKFIALISVLTSIALILTQIVR